MTAWTALLESFHSALIDELTARHPVPKPELGMPLRQARLMIPASADGALICEAVCGPAAGVIFLSIEAGCAAALGVSREELWASLLKRAGGEFMRRDIRPRIGKPVPLATGQRLPPGYPDPQRVIWIPMKVPAGACYLGMGI